MEKIGLATRFWFLFGHDQEEATEINLVLQSKWGSHRAYDRLVERHQRAIFNFLYFLVGEPALAEDLCYETFLRGYHELKSFSSRRKFSLWIFNLAWERAQSSVELARCARRFESPPEKLKDSQGFEAYLPALHEDQRAVLVLYDLLEFPEASISEVLNVSPGTVRTRLHGGRMALKSLLKKS